MGKHAEQRLKATKQKELKPVKVSAAQKHRDDNDDDDDDAQHKTHKNHASADSFLLCHPLVSAKVRRACQRLRRHLRGSDYREQRYRHHCRCCLGFKIQGFGFCVQGSESTISP